MTTLLFIHGMNGTAENWSDIPTRLSARVDHAEAVQLPGHDQPMSILDVLGNATYSSGLSMDDYVAAVAEKFPAGTSREVVLVGHSMGGAVISHVAAKHPDRIAGLIYMAAMLPADGQSADEILASIKSSGLIKPDALLGDFFPHIDKLSAVRQPEEPMVEPFGLTPAFDVLPRAYIRCTEDDVIPAPIQDKMLDEYSGTEIVTLHRSHFPQFDDPDELTATIQGLLPT